MRAHNRPVRGTRLVIALMVVLLPVLAAGPATAGGPTSVLLSAPALGRTASLYTTQAEYAALSEYVGVFTTAAGEGSGSPAPGQHALGDPVSLTWLIHDVTVWRVDRVYVDAPGGPWIASQESMGESIWDAPVTWHRSDEPKALTQLLGSLGLLTGETSVAPTTGSTPTPDQPQVATDPSDEVRPERAATDHGEETEGHGTLMLVLAGLAGLALGGTLTYVGTVAARRRSLTRAWAGEEIVADAEGLISDGPRVGVR